MSVFLPNARVSVYRDKAATQTTDVWGQQVDDPAPAFATADATGLPAYVSQKTQTVNDPGSGTVTVVTLYTIRLRPKAATLTAADRIRDEATGALYQVTTIGNTAGVVHATDTVLTCKRVN